MTYTRVFPQVGPLFTPRLPAVHPTKGAAVAPRRRYFQRVERMNPRMMKPKPMAMFHSPIAPIG